MKILHIIPSLRIGGAENLTVNLAVAQKNWVTTFPFAVSCILLKPECYLTRYPPIIFLFIFHIPDMSRDFSP